MNLVERVVSILRAVPRPLLPLVPLWIFGSAFALLLAAFTVLVIHLNSTRYHLTPWTGEPILLVTGDGLRPRERDIAQSKTARGRDETHGNAESSAPTPIAAQAWPKVTVRVERGDP